MKFNGPVRSTDSGALKCDLKIIQLLLKASNKSVDNSSSSNNGNSSNSSSNDNNNNNSSKTSNGNGNGNTNNDKEKETGTVEEKVEDIIQSSLSSKCLVEQLPNTLSISFRGGIRFY